VSGAPAEINPPEIVIGETQAPAAAPVMAEAPAPAAPPLEALPPLEELPPIGAIPSEEASEAVAAEMTQLAGAESALAAPAADAAIPSEPVPVAVAGEPDQVSAAVEPAASAQEPVLVDKPFEPEPVAATPEPAAVSMPVETQGLPAEPQMTASSPAMQEYGPVKSGETLSHIASKVNTDRSLTSQQVMLALMRANPSAFFGNNVNNLKTGKILKVPERDSMAAVPKAQAAREFRAQYDAWQEYKLKLAGASRMVAVAEPEKQAAEPEKKGTKKAAKTDKAGKPKAPAGKAEPIDLLKIVRANLEQETGEEVTKTPGVETKKDAAKEQGKLNERVATLEEAIESKQLQNKEMRERVGKLQEQVKNTERLIDLENKDLALAQKQTAEKQAAEAAAKAAQEKAAAEKAAAEKAAAEKAVQEKVAADKAAAEKLARENAAAQAAAKAQPAKPAAAPPAATAAKKPVMPPPPAPTEESFLDSILSGVMDNNMTLALLGVVGALAAGMGGLYAYRRRRASREFSESILSGSSLSSEASITDTSGQAVPSDTSFLSDFSQGGMGNIHTDEVDPIAEAEVYLAYGRDEQAEEILKDAIVKDPVRQELKGKLLEIYFQRNDSGAFETLAEELYAQLEGKGGKVWDKVEEMGRKLSPGNPMFRGGKPGKAAAAGTAAATTLLVSDTAGSGESSMASGLQFETQEMSATYSTPGETSAADSGSIDFNLDFTGSSAASPVGETPASLDMSFDLDETAASTPDSAAVPGGLGMDFSIAEPAAEESAPSSIDFSLDSAAIEPESTSGIDFNASLDTADSGGIDFSSGGMGDLAIELDSAPEGAATDVAEATLPGWDETATKLDLAKAYIDMGDSEGARSILDEVLAEGNDQQKQQARDLVSQIAA
jgi:pilus assembly protein FimV